MEKHKHVRICGKEIDSKEIDMGDGNLSPPKFK
jgi:hypothetical protein